jgi:hypothetical protein
MKTVDNAELRDSYLALSLQYERLAAILEKSPPAEESAPAPNPPNRRSTAS